MLKTLGVTNRNNFVMPTVVSSREQASGRILSFREQQTLTYLLHRKGNYALAWELADFVYGEGTDPQLGRMLVYRLRLKLGPSYIESSSFGYRIIQSRNPAIRMICARCGAVAVNYSDGWQCYGCPSTSHADLDVGRAEGPGEKSGKAWNADEEAFLSAHANDMSLDELGEILQRSGSSVRARLDSLGIEKRYVRRKR